MPDTDELVVDIAALFADTVDDVTADCDKRTDERLETDEVIEETELLSDATELVVELAARTTELVSAESELDVTLDCVASDAESDTTALLTDETEALTLIRLVETSSMTAALAIPVPSHDVTPTRSPGRCSGAPSACRTTADEPSMSVAFRPRRTVLLLIMTRIPPRVTKTCLPCPPNTGFGNQSKPECTHYGGASW